MPFLLLKYWRESAIGGLVVVILFLGVEWKKADVELKEARLVYSNPATKESVKRSVSKGAVRIIYRNTIIPGERQVIEKIVYRDPVIITTDSGRSSEPVSLKTTLAKPTENRVLLGVSHRDWTPGRWDHYGIWGGYSFKNRLDVLAGLTYHERAETNVMAVLRF